MVRRFWFVVAAALFAGMCLGCRAIEADFGAQVRPGDDARFVTGPNVESRADYVRIEFAVDRPTDVAVAILNSDGEVVRHLAAGLLGSNAPDPFEKDALAQTVVWDRRDDAGEPVPEGEYSVKVGLGLEAEFDRVLGWDPKTVGEIKALAVDPQGNLFCFNGYSVPGLAVFDREGEYIRTLLPHDATRAPGIRTLTREDGEEVPYLKAMRDPYAFGRIGVGGLRSSNALVLTPDGKILFGGKGSPRVMWMDVDGGIPEPLLGPALLPDGAPGIAGLVMSTEGDALYASVVGDEPAVYRVPWNGTPGEPVRLTDNLERSGALAVDADGNVYVCDRAAGTVAIFDADGERLGAIEAEDAWRVAVHPGTGAVYVAARESLKKFADRHAGEPVWTMELPAIPGNVAPVLALDPTGETPVLWLGSPQQRDWSAYVLDRIEDRGDEPGEPETFADRGPKALYSPVHLTVDPVRDEVYVREWRDGRGQWFRRIDGETGEVENIPIAANEMAVGPDGHLFGRSFHGGECGSWIARYDHDGELVPFENPTIPPQAEHRPGIWVLDSLRGATAIGMRGFDVAPNGDIHILRYFSARGGKGPWGQRGFEFPEFPPGVGYLTPLIDVYSPEGELKKTEHIAFFSQGAIGVRVDRAGNTYVADHIKPQGVRYVEELADQLPEPTEEHNRMFHLAGTGRVGWHINWYLFNTGSLFKFGPDGGRIRQAEEGDPGAQFAGSRWDRNLYVTIEGDLWQYTGISPSPADTNRSPRPAHCVCTGSRFDIDEFSRVYVPDVHRFCIDVLDANGNKLTSFGRYGNPDDDRPGIPINWGSYVGWSRNAVYICDNLNRRVVRVKLRYRAEETTPIP